MSDAMLGRSGLYVGTYEDTRCPEHMPRTTPPQIWRCDLPSGHRDDWHRHMPEGTEDVVAWHRSEDTICARARP